MLGKEKEMAIVRIRSNCPSKAAEWFCKELFFKKTSGTLISGNLRVELCRSECKIEPCISDAHQCGLRHIALETDDIRKALVYCRERGMTLETEKNGDPKFNGKVYGTGLRYFNILTDFGVVIEITEKHQPGTDCAPHIIWGLGHIGIETSNLEKSLEFYEQLGLKRDFLPVENQTPEGVVRCCMMSLNAVTLEIYEFSEKKNLPVQQNGALDALILPVQQNGTFLAGKKFGPSGECVEMLRCETVSA